MSKEGKNKGRRFWTCPNPRDAVQPAACMHFNVVARHERRDIGDGRRAVLAVAWQLLGKGEGAALHKQLEALAQAQAT